MYYSSFYNFEIMKYKYNNIVHLVFLIHTVVNISMSAIISSKSTNSLSNLPPVIKSNVIGTWAFDTMSRRIHTDILPRIISDNSELLAQPDAPSFAETFMQLNDLKSSLECGKTGYLRPICDGGPDSELWSDILATIPEEERNWIDAPWVISEFYFYRRIMEAFNYFESNYDPFVKQKVQGLFEALTSIEAIAGRLPLLLENSMSNDKSIAVEIALLTSLWGNKMDLSLWPASKTSTPTNSQNGEPAKVSEAGKISYGAALEAGKPYILDDHTLEVVKHLLSKKEERGQGSGGEGRIDIVVDNAGYELVSDLLLGYCMVKLGIASEVVFHTKGHPTFVSDATNEDCHSTIDFLSNINDLNIEAANGFGSFVHTPQLANELKLMVEQEVFKFKEDLFWCQPTAFWDMPNSVKQKLSGSILVVVKGDANYRRLLGERQWELSTPAKSILSYWPVPVCALRTFKAEIGCGISAASRERAEKEDSKWMVSGKWGVVQFEGK